MEFVKVELDRRGGLQGDRQRCRTINYVTERLFPLVKKLKKPEAAQVMYEFYHLNEKRLSSTIATKRELIIKLLMDGATAEDAFAQATRTTSESK